jgi:glucose-1-phosphate thymidylyltransferase
LLLAIEEKQLYDDDLLVIAADNVVTFSFRGFVDYFKEKQTSVIMTYYEQDDTALQRMGVITIDANDKVVEMQEKPQNPKSHYVTPPFYIYKKSNIKFIQECVSEGCNTDAPGSLVQSMLSKTVFHAWRMQGKRLDIGTLEAYNQVFSS